MRKYLYINLKTRTTETKESHGEEIVKAGRYLNGLMIMSGGGKMTRCHVCGLTEFEDREVDEIFQIEGQPVLVEHIPARVCARCGEAVFSRETTEHIRRIVHGEAKPLRTMQLNVFSFA